MHIVNIAAEIAPIAKVGGLGDVLYGLSRELHREGHQVEVIIPKYDTLDVAPIDDLEVFQGDLEVEFEGKRCQNTVWRGLLEGVPLFLIDSHDPKLLFSRGLIYGSDDDIDRFLYFSLTSLTFLEQAGIRPDILHLHDWHAAVCAPLCKTQFPGLGKRVLTIHNLSYQGRVLGLDVEKVGLKGADPALRDENDPTHCNLLKGGIAYSDAFTTVSKTYAKEIQTEEFGNGLHPFIKKNKKKLVGITNGLDYGYWNPETDPYLPVHFSSREVPNHAGDKETIDRKAFLKNLLREELMLEEARRPLIGCVARLVPQKGVNLIRHCIEFALERGAQFALLGSSPVPEIDREFHELMHAYSDHPHIRLILKHEEGTAHKIFGASDLFIVPSNFEPCGLTQLIAMRYGSIPVVRKTGGLADTVVDVATGFVFLDPTPESFNGALKRAVDLWYEEPGEWRQLVIRAMKQDFSWKKPAQEYVALFEKLLSC